MVRKVRGFDDKGNMVFERDAREYDRSISNTMFGVSMGDIVKAVPIIFMAGMIYMYQQGLNSRILEMVGNNTTAISSMSRSITRLNMYLSASTGKQFDDGVEINLK